MTLRPFATLSGQAVASQIVRRLDVWFCIAFVLGGAAIGGVTIWRNLYVDIYQLFMPDLLYYACGHGWVHPPETPRLVIDFLFSRVLKFDCAALAAPDPALPPGIFVNSQLYLAWFAGFIWRMSWPEYRNLWPLAALLVGSYVGGCFVLLRLFFSRWLAVIGALILMLSPIGLSMVISIRDYSKAPFFIWSFVLLVLAVRVGTSRASIGYATLSGAVIGLGYGFRSDIIIMLPIGLVFLLLVWPRHGWLRRGIAIGGFVAMTLALASPMLKIGNSGGFGSLMMQGLTDPYQRYLGLDAAPYSFGSRYSDELTLSTIAAELSAKDPEWVTKEARPGEGMTRAILNSGPYVLGWLPLFAGDIATQSLKSAIWILGMPALVSPERIAENWGVPILGRPPAARLLVFFYDAIGQSWLPWLGLVGIVVFLWQVSVTLPREAIALTVVFGAMLGYTFVQFAIRHVFHLEFLWMFAVFALLRTPFYIFEMKRGAIRFTVALAVVACLVIGARFALVTYQDSVLREQFDALLRQSREVVVTEARPVTETATLVRVPVPERYRALVAGPADSMDNAMGERGTQWQTIAAADRLVLIVGGTNCPKGKLNLTAQYTKRPTVWQPLDHEMIIDADGSSQVQVLLPAIYRATQYFEGIALPAAAAGCVIKIERIDGETSLPVILTAVLLPDWREQPLHRGFGGFPVRAIEPAATFKPR